MKSNDNFVMIYLFFFNMSLDINFELGLKSSWGSDPQLGPDIQAAVVLQCGGVPCGARAHGPGQWVSELRLGENADRWGQWQGPRL